MAEPENTSLPYQHHKNEGKGGSKTLIRVDSTEEAGQRGEPFEARPVPQLTASPREKLREDSSASSLELPPSPSKFLILQKSESMKSISSLADDEETFNPPPTVGIPSHPSSSSSPDRPLAEPERRDNVSAGSSSNENNEMFDLLDRSNSFRINSQRSATNPAVKLDFDATSSAPGSPQPGVSIREEASRRKSQRFLRMFSRASTIEKNHLAELCVHYYDSVDEAHKRNIELAAMIKHPDNSLVKEGGGWVAETLSVDQVPQYALPATSSLSDIVSFVDADVRYYREHFLHQDHHNYVGVDERYGGVVLSLRREKLGDEVAYRLLVRTSLEGSRHILIPASHVTTRHHVPTIKDVVLTIFPTIQVGALREVVRDSRVLAEILKLDECMSNVEKNYKIGVLPCEDNKTKEEQMYSIEKSSDAFEEFLECIGSKVTLQGFAGFRGGLDTKENLTGAQSVYTEFQDNHIMCHVSTLIPFDPSNPQQVQRKRHIGNDLVAIVFQSDTDEPILSSTLVSQFVHVVIVVRVFLPNTSDVSYRVSCLRRGDVPWFGPSLPSEGVFDAEAIHSGRFREFLLSKVINGENAAYLADYFTKLRDRTRVQLIDHIVEKYSTDIHLPGFKTRHLRMILLPSYTRKKSGDIMLGTKEVLTWPVKLDRGTEEKPLLLNSLFAVSSEICVVLEEDSQNALHNFPSHSIRGWSVSQLGLKLHYGRGEEVFMHCSNDVTKGILEQLRAHTAGSLIIDIVLKRDGPSQPWGFTFLERDVTNVVPGGVASRYGLTTDHYLFKVNDILVSTLEQAQIVSLIKKSDLVLDLKVSLKASSALPYINLPTPASPSFQKKLILQDPYTAPVGSSTPKLDRFHAAITYFDGNDLVSNTSNLASYNSASTPNLSNLTSQGSNSMNATDSTLRNHSTNESHSNTNDSYARTTEKQSHELTRDDSRSVRRTLYLNDEAHAFDLAANTAPLELDSVHSSHTPQSSTLVEGGSSGSRRLRSISSTDPMVYKLQQKNHELEEQLSHTQQQLRAAYGHIHSLKAEINELKLQLAINGVQQSAPSPSSPFLQSSSPRSLPKRRFSERAGTSSPHHSPTSAEPRVLGPPFTALTTDAQRGGNTARLRLSLHGRSPANSPSRNPGSDELNPDPLRLVPLVRHGHGHGDAAPSSPQAPTEQSPRRPPLEASFNTSFGSELDDSVQSERSLLDFSRLSTASKSFDFIPSTNV